LKSWILAALHKELGRDRGRNYSRRFPCDFSQSDRACHCLKLLLREAALKESMTKFCPFGFAANESNRWKAVGIFSTTQQCSAYNFKIFGMGKAHYQERRFWINLGNTIDHIIGWADGESGVRDLWKDLITAIDPGQ